ncbi:MAG: phosphoadenylyl-sulfate reductase [Parvularcula sp.]|jgi:phosphoadenosine phosphosulfate reductase|nr:phosphoadenylyl-sulfate reductase [Parvularcula sp.]
MTAALLKPSAGETDRELQARALSARFLGASPDEVIRFSIEEGFAGRIALVSSFGAEAAVLLHMVSTIEPNLPVVFLETGKHFAQTLSYRRKLAAQLGLNHVIDVHPDKDEAKAEDPGEDLWRRDADACCDLRKVRPLENALAPFEAWFTGRKAFHGGERMRLPIFEWNGTHMKVNPLVAFTPEDIAAYRQRHELPAHPLVAQGFPSIGCWPCTKPVGAGDDVRAGRWRGQSKAECGIHGR